MNQTKANKPVASRTRLFVKSLGILALSLSSVHESLAELSWDARQFDFHPSVTDQKADAEFAFTNIGQSDVTLVEVKTSCGCTTAALDKKTYGPGEKGTIKATFTFGDRVGLQQKQVMVRTDSPEDPLVQLTMRAFIPELLKWAPKVVRWELNGKPIPQAVQVTTGTEQPMHILGVRTSDDRVFAKLKSIEPGRKYEIAVTPMVTTAPMRAQVWIETDFPAERPKVYQLAVEVGTPSRSSSPVPTVGAQPQPNRIGPLAPQPPRPPVAPLAPMTKGSPVKPRPQFTPAPARVVPAATPMVKATTAKQ